MADDDISFIYDIHMFRDNTTADVLKEIEEQTYTEDFGDRKGRVHVRLGGDFQCTEQVKDAVIHFMENCPCFFLSLHSFTNETATPVNPLLREMIMKCAGKCLNMSLHGSFSDDAMVTVYDFIKANNGIEALYSNKLILTEISSALFSELLSSNKLGTEDDDSFLELFLDSDYPDHRLARMVRTMTGFKQVRFVDTWFVNLPETFRALGQNLSSENCGISNLDLDGDYYYNERDHFGEVKTDCLKIMFEELTTNTSLLELGFCARRCTFFTMTDLVSLASNLHKFKQLKSLCIRIDEDSPLDLLRPLLDPSLLSIQLPPSSSTTTITANSNNNTNKITARSSLFRELLHGICIQDYPPRKLSPEDNKLLMDLALTYPNLTTFGYKVQCNPVVDHQLCMNGGWRQLLTHTANATPTTTATMHNHNHTNHNHHNHNRPNNNNSPSYNSNVTKTILPALWPVVFAAIMRERKVDHGTGSISIVRYEDETVASICYDMIQQLVSMHFSGSCKSTQGLFQGDTFRQHVFYAKNNGKPVPLCLMHLVFAQINRQYQKNHHTRNTMVMTTDETDTNNQATRLLPPQDMFKMVHKMAWIYGPKYRKKKPSSSSLSGRKRKRKSEKETILLQLP